MRRRVSRMRALAFLALPPAVAAKCSLDAEEGETRKVKVTELRPTHQQGDKSLSMTCDDPVSPAKSCFAFWPKT